MKRVAQFGKDTAHGTLENTSGMPISSFCARSGLKSTEYFVHIHVANAFHPFEDDGGQPIGASFDRADRLAAPEHTNTPFP